MSKAGFSKRIAKNKTSVSARAVQLFTVENLLQLLRAGDVYGAYYLT
jgi:hypothetical protein